MSRVRVYDMGRVSLSEEAEVDEIVSWTIERKYDDEIDIYDNSQISHDHTRGNFPT